jgi:hypothetical protein
VSVREAILNQRIRTFLTGLSLVFAVLLVVQVIRDIVYPPSERQPAPDRHRVVDRPADAAPTANPARTPGRSLIRPTHRTAQAG